MRGKCHFSKTIPSRFCTSCELFIIRFKKWCWLCRCLM